MSKFKIGDKVRYKESEKEQCIHNEHEFGKEYVIKSICESDGFVRFENTQDGTFDYRLELVPETQEEETFDYKQALKILAENPETNIQMLSANTWINTKSFGSITIYTGTTLYRIKPTNKPKYHFVIKSKGKFAVTSQKYTCEEDVKAAYSYPVKVIQKLED